MDILVTTDILALASALLAGLSTVIITPVAKQGMASRLLVVRSGFAVLFIPLALLALPQEIGFGTITGFGVSVVLLVSGPLFALGTLIYYRGIRSLGLGRAYPMVSTFPLFSTLMAVLVLGERPHWLVLVGTVIIVAGVWLVARAAARDGSRLRFSLDHAACTWLAIMAGAALLFGISNTANKLALDTGLSPLLVNLGRIACAGSLTAAAGLAWGSGLSLRSLPRRSWALIAISAFTGDLVGNWLYLLALQLGHVSTVVPLAATSPLFIIPMARLVLKETITRPLAVGTMLTMVGVVLVAVS
jgi:drug/metabolite transporter (DMT)-like permease